MRRTALTMLVLGVLASGCSVDRDGDDIADSADRCPRTPAARQVDREGCSDLGRALQHGRDALLTLPSFAAGDVWVLQRLLRLEPDPEIAQLVSRWIAKLAESPFARQLDPEHAPASLPEDPGHGIRKLYSFILSPFAEPRSRALRFIREYLDQSASHYVLTHQYLMIPWSEEQGLELPADLKARGSTLLEHIRAEQAEEPVFSDLFVERAALLLAFAQPQRELASVWVDTILAAQLPGGAWQEPHATTLEFDGQKAPAYHPPSHTSAFALWALALYRERFAPAAAG